MYIRELTIFTEQLHQQKQFYSHTLGLPVLAEEEGIVRFAFGNTNVAFTARPSATAYHFALNIPAGDEVKALEWLRGRVDILTDQGREIQDFNSWNAHSVYFYDPDHNIVEFIARRNLLNATDRAFGPDSILEVSELGLATDGIGPYYLQLKEKAGLQLYDGDLEKFGAIGDEHGLFICINRQEKTWYPTGDPADPSPFELYMTAHNQDYLVTYSGGALKIRLTNSSSFGIVQSPKT